MLSASKIDQLIIRAEWWLRIHDLESQTYQGFNKGISGEDSSYIINTFNQIQIEEINIKEDLEQHRNIWTRVQAIKCYKKALHSNPHHIFALARLGLLYLSLIEEINDETKNQYIDNALICITHAFDLNPAEPTVNFILGYIYGFYNIDLEKSRKHYQICQKESSSFFITLEQDSDDLLNYQISDHEYVSVFLNYYQLEEFYRYAINDFPDPALMWIDLMCLTEISDDGILHLPEQYRDALIQIPENKRQYLGYKILQLMYFRALESDESNSDRNLAIEVYQEFFYGQSFEWLKDLKGWWLSNIQWFSIDAVANFLLRNNLIDESKRVYQESCHLFKTDDELWENRIRLLQTSGTPDEIISACQEGLKFLPHNIFFYKEIIGAYTSLNDRKSANHIFEEGRKLFSTDTSFMMEYWYQKFIAYSSKESSYQEAEFEIKNLFTAETWKALDTESKRDLITAHYFYRTYASDSDSLFSAASIAHGYCRAWECEVEKHITKSIIEEIERKQYRRLKGSETIEIGNAKIKIGSATPVQIGRVIIEAQKNENAGPNAGAVNRRLNHEVKKEFPTLANKIGDYRNKANHPHPFSKKQLDELILLVVGKNNDGAIAKIHKWTKGKN